MSNPVPLTPAPRLIARLPVFPVAFFSLLMAGCAQAPPPVDPNVLLPPPVRKAPTPAAAPAATSDGKPAVAASASLAPLATPQQVVGAVNLGRLDPFGALINRFPTLLGPDGKPLPVNLAGGGSGGAAAPGAAAGGTRPGGAPATAGGGKGTRSSAPLQLPPGWSVAAIDVNRGLITLQKNGQRVSAEL